MNEQLPIFVYGTLLPGHPNFERQFEGLGVTSKPARLTYHTLLANERSYFPYLVLLEHVPKHVQLKDVFTTTQGSLLTIPTEHYDKKLADLDWLEGVGNGHYERVEVVVLTGDSAHRAWAYRLPAKDVAEFFVSPFCKHPSWLDHVREHDTYSIKE